MDITAQLTDPNLGIRLRAINSLRELPPAEAVPLLALVLADSNTRVRYSAISLLGSKPTPETYDLLVHSLNHDPEFDVRAGAAASLGDLKDERALPELLAAYERDGETMVRFSILAALGELGDPRGFDLLVHALGVGGLQEEAALMALGQLNLPEAIPYLVDYLAHPDWQLRLRAVQALETMGQQDLLRDRQDENPTVQQALAVALGL